MPSPPRFECVAHMYLGVYTLIAGVAALVYLLNGGKIFFICLGIFGLGVLLVMMSAAGVHNRLVCAQEWWQ